MYPEEADMWPDELEAFDMAEAADFMPEDVMSEAELEMFDNSAALAEALLEVLNDDYADATPEEAEEVLSDVLETMPLAEAFNFKKVLGQIAQTGLPLAGGAAGTLFGGPAGTAIGGKLGQMAAQAVSGSKTPGAQAAMAKPAGAAFGAAGPLAKASSDAGPAAAKKFLNAIQNPAALTAILALAFGEAGRKSVKVGEGGQSVPASAIAGMLSQLASEAAAEADEFLGASEETSAYLTDGEGHFLADPAVPEERAEALYRLLCDAERQRLKTEMATYSAYFPDDLDSDDDAAEGLARLRRRRVRYG